MLGELLIAAGIACIACSVIALRRSGGAARQPAQVPAADRAPRAPDRQAVLDAAALLLPHGPRIESIQLEMRVSGTVFDDHCRPLIDRYAEFVQLLPASESHHHAEPGGLLLHALETASHALRARRAALVQGAAAEDQASLQHRFTWCVLAGALLHDVAKPLTDLRVTWWPAGSGEGTVWSPLAGSLPGLGAFDYRVEFAAGRRYEEHATLALALLQRFAPDATLAWVAAAPSLLQELSALLRGDPARGNLGKLVQDADRASVRQNLLTGSRVRFASARAVPLIERLMAGLRRMLAEGMLPLNRSGACGWVFEGDLWLVAGRIADELREYLARTEVGAGAALPSHDKNDRLFDCWQDYGACLPTPEGRAVWRVRITGADYSHELTCLRFPLNGLVQDSTGFPVPMVGSVVVLGGAVCSPPGDVEAGAGAAKGKQLAPAGRAPGAAPAHVERDGVGSAEPDAASQPAGREPHGTAAGARGGAEILPQPDAAVADLGKDSDLLDEADRAGPPAPARAAPAMTRAVAPSASIAAPGADSVPAIAQRFMGWLQHGLGAGTIPYNQAQGLVHFVADGMFLVSPRAFVAFISQCGAMGDGLAADEPERKSINRIQGALAKAGWTVPAPAGRGNSIHKLQTLKRGQRGAVLNGLIVPEPARFVNPVPPVNALLVPYVEGATEKSA